MRIIKTLFVIAIFPCSIFAQTNWTYIGPNPGVWNDPNNWDIGTVPTNIGADDSVVVPFPTTVTIDVDINNQGDINIGGAVTNDETVDNFGSFIAQAVCNNFSFNNAGSFYTTSFENNLGFLNTGTSTCTNVIQSNIFSNDGTFVVVGSFICSGGINNIGHFENEGYFQNNVGSTITNLGTFNNDPNSSSNLVNNGTILNMGTLSNERTITNSSTGSIENDGTLVNMATFNNQGEIENDGVIKGTGDLTQNLSATFTHLSNASLEPGNSIGTLTVNGNLDFGQATYKAEFDGANSSIDLIDVSGNIDLSNSSLELTWLAPPTASGTYDLIQFGGRIGQFSNVNIPALPNYLATINYTSNAVQLILTGIVPVGLTSFSGQQIESDIHLHWVTSSEINNEGFYIERQKTNGLWESLDFVSGNNNTNQESKYSYIDTPDQEKRYLYRLRQVDFDGSLTYSDMISVNYSNQYRSSGLSDIQRSGLSSYYFESNTDLSIAFALYNEVGELLYFYHALSAEWVDLSQFSTGMYFYSAQQGKDRVSGKLFLE